MTVASPTPVSPLISVILPYYRKAEYLNDALTSVFAQSFTNWECIVVDDGSKDGVAAVMKEWQEKDNRFHFYEKQNGGVSSARNFAIEKATGQWILPLDPDDIIAPDYLELASASFNSNYSLIYCVAEKFGDEEGIWQLPEFSLENMAEDNVIFNAAFFRKTDWQALGGYDEQLPILEDWDFWISMVKNGAQVLKLDKTCFFYRIKQTNSLMKDTRIPLRVSCFQRIARKHKDFFTEHLRHSKNRDLLDWHRKMNMDSIPRFFFRLYRRIENLATGKKRN